MADYASMKVPELKKLLGERGLTQSGNKADLIARLQENDTETAEPAKASGAAEDEIDWDDEDDAAKASAPAPAKTEEPNKPAETKKAPAPAKPAPAAAEPAKEVPQPAAADVKAPEATDVPATKEGEAEKPAEEPSKFAIGLAASSADEEAKKREARAKRFGIVVEESSEEAKKAERAKRFGVDEAATIVKGLDSALPERRPKRGRDRGDEGEGGGKRATQDGGRRDGQHRGGRGGHGRKFRGGRGGGAPRDQQRGTQGGGAPRQSILQDPEEKRKAEARAKRFGGA